MCRTDSHATDWVNASYKSVEVRRRDNLDAASGRFGTNHGDRLSIGWWYGGNSPDKWLDRRGPLPEGTNLHEMGITVGQGVGALTEIKPAADVFAQLRDELLEAVATMPASKATATARL